MRKTAFRLGLFASLAGLSALAGCGRSATSSMVVAVGHDGGSDGTPTGPGGADAAAPPPPSAWTELAEPSLVLEGGAATSKASGQAQGGGTIHLVSKGGLALDPALPVPPLPTAPAASAGETLVGADALAADVSATGAVRLAGHLKSDGVDATRQITSASGDIIVEGTLRGADLGNVRQSLALHAPHGTVFVSGTVDTSGAAGTGQAGGSITIDAQRVVVTGKLASHGGDSNTAGGAGGAVTITATDAVVVSGAVDSFGGDARGPGTVSGGAGGALTLLAHTDVTMTAVARLRGGAATSTGTDAHGGDAGLVQIDAAGAVTLGGTLDARGGLATAAATGGGVVGGAATSLRIGETSAPSSIAVLVLVSSHGGHGTSAGGRGGDVTLEARGGDLDIRSALDAGGGDSGAAPGGGGTIIGNAGHASGGIHVSGTIKGVGGSVDAGGTGNGGEGSTLTLEVLTETGDLVIEASGVLDVDGGKSGGNGTAGGGGHINLFTRDGDLTVSGQVLTRGGAAPDPGGIGGLGGAVDVFSDNNHNGVGGNLSIEPTGIIDASGGSGSTGGNARNNGSWGVAAFPTHQEELAVLVNCDGRHGTTQNWLRNLGHIIARGGATNGWGGDIAYHGIAPDRNASPPSGNIDTSADGTGMPGHFRGE